MLCNALEPSNNDFISLIGCKNNDVRNVARNRGKGGHGALWVLRFLMATLSTKQLGEFT